MALARQAQSCAPRRETARIAPILDRLSTGSSLIVGKAKPAWMGGGCFRIYI